MKHMIQIDIRADTTDTATEEVHDIKLQPLKWYFPGKKISTRVDILVRMQFLQAWALNFTVSDKVKQECTPWKINTLACLCLITQ